MFNENCIFDTASLGNRIYIGGDKTYVPQFQWLIYGGSNNTYKANNVYSMHIRQAISVLDYDLIENLYLFQYFSNTSSSSSGAISGYSNANLYSMSCSLSQYDTYAFDINCNFVPKRDIKYISVQLYLSDYDYSVDSQTDVRWTTLEMSYEEDVSSVINNQTTIIQNEFNQTNQNITEINDTLNQEHQYNNNGWVDTTTEKEEMESFEEEEQELRDNLNLNIENSEIIINENASNFIWEIINQLRGINGKIVLLFTSVLSLGIMKMILSR